MRRMMILAVLSFCAAFCKAEDFHAGVYIYDYTMISCAKANEEDLYKFVEKHFKILKKNGVEVIHLTVNNGSKKEYFKNIFLPLLEKYGIKAYLQLDFAYYFPGPDWTEKHENQQAEQAGKFIQQFQGNPWILGFSIREEIDDANVHGMARYYQKILQYAPGTKILTVHSGLGPAKDQPVPDPSFFGTDRYCFWWEFSGNGYLASPSFSLNWLRQEAASYHAEAAKRGADFVFVSTQGGLIIGARGIENLALKSRPELKNKILKFAQENRFGWTREQIGGKELIWVWKYYRMPENCLRATIWTGVLEGAKCVLFWSYVPVSTKETGLAPGEAMLNRLDSRKRNKGEYSYFTLAGRPGAANPQLEEFAETAAELKPFARLIGKMSKCPDSPVCCRKSNQHFNRSFSIPSYKGRVIVLHNADVGTWPCNSKYFFSDQDTVRIDKTGNLVGYQPKKTPAKVSFTVKTTPVEYVFSFADGKKLNAENGCYSLEIAPGSGTFIFAGTETEFKKLLSEIRVP